MPPLSEHDRVLFLSPPEGLREIARQLTQGLVVVLGSDDETSQARALHADLDNVMFISASAEEIPWQDRFFTQVVDPAGLWANSPKAQQEASRVRVGQVPDLPTGSS